MKLLPRTPAPYPDEGLFAYVLRLSQANSYLTPKYIAYSADISRTHWMQPLASYPATKLEPLIGGHHEILQQISYVRSVGHSSVYKILSHDLGRQSVGPLRLCSPAFCIDCVLEDGYIRAFWDLAAAVACPRHACLPVDKCPTCKEPLKWYRPHLLRCGCNGDISKSSRVEAAPLVVDLMKVVQAKLEKRPHVECDVRSPLSLAPLDALNLADLVRLIGVFGGAETYVPGKTRPANSLVEGQVHAAAQLLSEWPRQLEKWLQRIASTNQTDALPQPIRRIVSALFWRRRLSTGMQRIKEAFVSLAQRHWPSLLVTDQPRAKRTGDRQASSQPIAARIISARLGIPVGTLRILRERGLYGSGASPRLHRTIHDEEARDFEARMLALAADAPKGIECKKLEQLLGLKFRNAAVKADLIEALITRALPVVGQAGGKVSDLLLGKEAVECWLQNARARENNDSYSFPEAAALLELDLNAIPAAIGAALLETIEVEGRKRITVGSVLRFQVKYVPLSAIALSLKTSADALIRCATKNGVPVVSLARVRSKIKQSLISRANIPKLEALYKVVQAQAEEKKRIPCDVLEARISAALAEYIARSQARDEALPRRAGKLNKVAIARACGFDRNEFYVRPKLALALDDAYKAERTRRGAHYFDPTERLRIYLEDLRASDKQIPRWGGKPHLLAIAAACGIDRNHFYKGAEALHLVREFSQKRDFAGPGARSLAGRTRAVRSARTLFQKPS
jgi:hypothetical protein